MRSAAGDARVAHGIADGGWPYLAGRQSRLEPTCWAMLALGDAAAPRTLISLAAGPSGLIVEPMVPSVNHTFNAIAALALASPEIGRDPRRKGDRRALLDAKGIRMAIILRSSRTRAFRAGRGTTGRSAGSSRPPGACWQSRSSCRDHPAAPPRLDEAQRVLADRACAEGGWNYGNKQVYRAGVVAARANDRCRRARAPGSQDRIRSCCGPSMCCEQQAPREGPASRSLSAWIALTAVKQSEAARLHDSLSQRVEIAESVGNLAVVAMLLYALSEWRNRDNLPPSWCRREADALPARVPGVDVGGSGERMPTQPPYRRSRFLRSAKSSRRHPARGRYDIDLADVIGSGPRRAQRRREGKAHPPEAEPRRVRTGNRDQHARERHRSVRRLR